jgi:CYTH domain-containing protein/predicted ATPase
MAKRHVRRFILPQAPNLTGCPSTRLIQGYFETKMGRLARVRLFDNSKAEIEVRIGRADTDDSGIKTIERSLARHLIDTLCHDSVIKYRYVLDGWRVYRFNDTLSGLVTAEAPNSRAPLPVWMAGAAEVTGTLTDHQLARLAGRLATEGGFMSNVQPPTNRTKCIVVTGATRSGRSLALRAARRNLGNRVHCVPEAAMILGSLVGRNPADEEGSAAAFQRRTFAVQKLLEQAAADQCRTEGKEAVLIDQGSLDAAAQLKGGVAQLEKACGIDGDRQLLEYDAVIILEPAPGEVFEKTLGEGIARNAEARLKAVALHEKLRLAWSRHPRVHEIPSHPSFKEKEDRVINTVSEILDS